MNTYIHTYSQNWNLDSILQKIAAFDYKNDDFLRFYGQLDFFVKNGLLKYYLDFSFDCIDFGRIGMSIVWTQCPDNRAWNKTADVRELVLVGDKCDNPVDFTEMLLWRFIGSLLVRRISGLLRVRKQLRKFRLKELFVFSHASRIRQYFTVYKSRNEHKNCRFIDVTVGFKKSCDRFLRL